MMVVALNLWAFEPPLPDMPDASMPLVISPGMRDQKRLHDPADRHPRFRTQQEVEMIGHQAIAVQPKGVTQLRLPERGEKRLPVRIVVEDGLAIIAPAQGMESEAVIVRSEWSSHSQVLDHRWDRRRI